MTEQAMDFARSALKEQGERIERLEEALREILDATDGRNPSYIGQDRAYAIARAILSKSHGGGDGEGKTE